MATKEDRFPPKQKDARGFNPMRHNCDSSGCYLKLCHPKTEVFCDAFPGKISFSDIDSSIVERYGRGIVYEHKRTTEELARIGDDAGNAQYILWKNITIGKVITLIAAAGDPVTMEIEAYRLCWDGEWQDVVVGNREEVIERMRRWFKWADENPRVSRG